MGMVQESAAFEARFYCLVKWGYYLDKCIFHPLMFSPLACIDPLTIAVLDSLWPDVGTSVVARAMGWHERGRSRPH